MLKVLIVEDSLTDTEHLTQALCHMGLTVINACDGDEAERQLKQLQPDLVILDVVLPGRSGFELCRQLKRNVETQEIPVVICSTKTTEADKIWGNMLGANAYLTKPINESDLVTTIRRLLRI